MTRALSSGEFRAMFAPPRRVIRRAMGDAASQGHDVGAAAGAAYATSEFGPEAAPVGELVGGFVGGTVAGGVSDLFGGGTAPCECQLGSCDDNDDFSPTKYGVLRSQCDPAVAALIDQQVLAAVAPLRAQQGGLVTVDMVNRIEICLKLSGYAKAAAEHWKLPPQVAAKNPVLVEAARRSAACQAAGYSKGYAASLDRSNLQPSQWSQWAPSAASGCEGAARPLPRASAPLSTPQKLVVGTAAVGTAAALGWVAWKFVPWGRLFG